ncbi:hypothetical protein HKX48_001410 [Thoreauomyces humboldtii]|nr:hypothetical protein HKX48_001410 [Thoreauomyces humboldtii]
MDANGQKLFVRLFSRGCKWIRLSSLKYREVDIPLGYAALCDAGNTLVSCELDSLEELLIIMSGVELKAFAKDSQLLTSQQKRWAKKDCIEAIMLHAENQSLLIGNPLERTKKRVKRILGPLVKLRESVIDVFERVMVIYFRSMDILERPMIAGILSEVERWTFPDFEVDRSKDIFKTRQAAVEYFDALRLQATIEKCIETRRVSDCLQHVSEIQLRWEASLGDGIDQDVSQYFLSQFTSARVYTALLTTFSLDILPTLRQHAAALEILHILLSQQRHGRGSRGKWWDQLSHLTLNYGESSKSDREEYALELCVEAIRDPLVRAGWLVKIRRRMERLARLIWARKMEADAAMVPVVVGKRKKKSAAAKILDSGWDELVPGDVRARLVDLTIRDPTETVFTGTKLPDNATGRKSRWDIPDDLPVGFFDSEDGASPVSLTVEQVALARYAHRGYKGLHIENALFHHLFGLLFYTELYVTPTLTSVVKTEGQQPDPQSRQPSVFQTRFQTQPLDLFTDGFYASRSTALESRCNLLSSLSRAELARLVMETDARLRPRSVRGAGLSWTAIPETKLEELVMCMHPPALVAVLTVMAQAYKDHCGGLPDLVLWKVGGGDAGDGERKEELGHVKLVEVKGPGDRLSEKQIMWMDVLAAAGWDVEICKVVHRAGPEVVPDD